MNAPISRPVARTALNVAVRRQVHAYRQAPWRIVDDFPELALTGDSWPVVFDLAQRKHRGAVEAAHDGVILSPGEYVKPRALAIVAYCHLRAIRQARRVMEPAAC